MTRFSQAFERVLEGIVIALMVSLTTVIVVAVVYRKLGASLTWYDEVASIMLAWLTYYGGALAAYKRAHIGFPGLLQAMPQRQRVALFWVGEAFMLCFFVLLAWVGIRVLEVLEGDTLVSLPWVPIQFTQSVIPIGAGLFLAGQLISLPAQYARVREGRLMQDDEVVLEDEADEARART